MIIDKASPKIIFIFTLAIGLGIGTIGLITSIALKKPAVSSGIRPVANAAKTSSQPYINNQTVATDMNQVMSIADNENQQSDEEENLKIILETIDQIAHPDDSQNPQNLMGMTDEELVGLPSDDILALIEEALPYAEKQLDNPRYLFALGRAEWLHGNDEQAFQILSLAAENGSAAANGYLARIVEDWEETTVYLQKAVDGGFPPAKEWMEELDQMLAESEAEEEKIILSADQEQKRSDIDFNAFSFPAIMCAFYEGNTKQYTKEPILYINYVASVNDALNDQSMLFMVENPREYKQALDPNLSFEVGRRMATSMVATKQAIGAGLNMFRGMLEAMANTRQSGGSVQDEVVAMNKALLGDNRDPNSKSVYVTIKEMEQYGTKDGQILGFLFDQNPDAFKKIYKGMQVFVREQL